MSQDRSRLSASKTSFTGKVGRRSIGMESSHLESGARPARKLSRRFCSWRSLSPTLVARWYSLLTWSSLARAVLRILADMLAVSTSLQIL
ncbi:MAG: hypothetical protein ACK559_01210, partial [bacterium]